MESGSGKVQETLMDKFKKGEVKINVQYLRPLMYSNIHFHFLGRGGEMRNFIKKAIHEDS